MSALCQCSFLLLQANLALHLTSLLVSLWCPGPSPPVIFRVEVLLCLVALVFFFFYSTWSESSAVCTDGP